MLRCISYRFVLMLAVLLVNFHARGQADLPIYTDNLVNGFQDWGWIPRNFANTSPVHSGSYSISATANGQWQGLSFEEPIYNSYAGGFNTSLYSNLVFWAHGGSTGGQILQVDVEYQSGSGDTNGPGNSLAALPANAWQQYTIPLSSLLPSGVSNLFRINIQLTPYGTTNTFYIDDISLTAKPAPVLQHLSVDATQVLRTADARWFGVNTAIWDGDLDTSATSNTLSKAGILSLRFPGGSASDQYHWATGQSIAWSNGLPLSTNYSSSNFKNFMHLATNAGVQAFITVNYGSGTSNEAAGWVLNANVTNHCNFKYWEVGNEVYGNWEQDTNNPPNDPYTYARRFAGYQALIKAAYPGAKVGAVCSAGEDSYNTYTNHSATNSSTHAVHYGWTPVMLATMKSIGVTPDFLIYHLYPEYTPFNVTPVPVNDSDALVLQVSSQVAGDASNLRMMINNYFGTGGTNIELCCTENNSDAGAEGRQMTSLVNALYVADTLGQFMKTEFNAYTWWDLRNGPGTSGSFDPTFYGWRTVGDEGLVYGTNTFYPDYYAMKLMQYFIRPGDTVLNAGSDYLLLSSYAARRADGSLTLLVLNKNANATFTSQIALSNFVPSSSATIHSYGIPQDNAAKNGVGSPDIAQTNLSGASTNFTFSFAPYSMTVFTFAPAAPKLAVLTPGSTGEIVFQIQGQTNVPYVLQSSTNLATWISVSTNTLASTTLNVTNSISQTLSKKFWRAVWVP